MRPRFTKCQGLGNDYIVIESDQLGGVSDLGQFANRMCNRHFGAGGDGIAIISPTDTKEGDFRVRIFNPDGSEAELSGNGTRCAATYLHYNKLWTAYELRLSTRAGVKKYFLREHSGARYVFDSELGQPKFDSKSIPMITTEPLEKVINYPLAVDGAEVNVTALQMGNPNCCIFVSSFKELDWRHIGRTLETHPAFPERTNVTFVRIQDPKTIELRIWERGVGETTASGTCSCAAAVAAMINKKTERAVKALMPGGQARIQWRDDGGVVLTGGAEVVYNGDWLAD